MILELKRNFVAVPLMGFLGIMNGCLYLSLYWGKADFEFGPNESKNGAIIRDLVGLAFMLTSD